MEGPTLEAILVSISGELTYEFNIKLKFSYWLVVKCASYFNIWGYSPGNKIFTKPAAKENFV